MSFLSRLPRMLSGGLCRQGVRFGNFFASMKSSHLLQQHTTSPAFLRKWEAARAFATDLDDLTKLRNIGISAHIDSGKTTLTERILFYTGRIRAIHEVRGKDGVGAKMDSMDLEREKGITIQSAATYTNWKDYQINIIDTPGHVDFTIEVERALRVLDGAILVVCSVGGVQSQTITVDRQMRRYNVPRMVFINKLDRAGADPYQCIQEINTKLGINAAAVQLTQANPKMPIGLEAMLSGVVDLVSMKAIYFEGDAGEDVQITEIPDGMREEAEAKQKELVWQLAESDDTIGEYLIEHEEAIPPSDMIKAAIRRQTLARTFVPVFMGSAFKNKGVQPLLDGVLNYLPNPTEVENIALDRKNEESEVVLSNGREDPLVALAFKLEESRFGQLTYLRVYQGSMQRGDTILNVNDGKKIKVPRLVRMHSNEMEEIQEIGAGEICAMFGVDCASGHTFTDGRVSYTMTSMHVPEPVMSLSLKCKGKRQDANFSKALSRFQKRFLQEDPTFRVHTEKDTGETIISGMGELHLDIYVERMRREYNTDCETGRPRVAYRETVNSDAKVAYTHRKQTGGRGQFAKVEGTLEALDINEGDVEATEFVDEIIGASIPPEYIPACQKGFQDALEKGPLVGHPMAGVRFVLKDGAFHPVDSSEMAFRYCTMQAIREAVKQANGVVLEPIMKLEVIAPIEFQGNIVGNLSRRRGIVVGSETQGVNFVAQVEVPLAQMFGYSTALRSQTQGKGEFTMEYLTHRPVPRDEQQRLEKEYAAQRKAEES